TNDPAACPGYGDRFISRDIHESALTGTVCRRGDHALVDFYPVSLDRNGPRITGTGTLRRDRSSCRAVTGQEQVADFYDDVACITESKSVCGEVRSIFHRQSIRVYCQCATLATSGKRIRNRNRRNRMEVALCRESCK